MNAAATTRGVKILFQMGLDFIRNRRSRFGQFLTVHDLRGFVRE